MPGINGFEVCSRLKANPLLKDACVIAVTADTATDAPSRILEMGARVCLAKPIDMNLLANEVAKALGRPV